MILFTPLLLHQTIIYNLKLTHKIKNSLIIFSKLFYIFIILGLINIIPIALLFINNGMFIIIVLLFDCLFLIPILIILNTLVTDSTFDAFINYYPLLFILEKDNNKLLIVSTYSVNI